MIGKNYLYLIFFVFFSPAYSGLSQDSDLYDLSAWNKQEIKEANSAYDSPLLSVDEKNVIFYINLARMNPRLFRETILKQYLVLNNMGDNKWTRSLNNDLRKLKPLPPLIVREDLFKEAKKHAEESGRKGMTGHADARGRPYKKRITYLLKSYPLLFENCYYGEGTPVEIVLDLLVDEGTPGYGHRKALLNQQVRYCGVSIQPHVKYGYNCVMELGK